MLPYGRNRYFFLLVFCLFSSSLFSQTFYQPFFVERFESTPAGWTVSGGGWQFGTPTYSSGPSSAYEGAGCAGTILNGAYANSVAYYLVSPVISLPNTDTVRMSFYEWYYLESCCDYYSVQITLDSGRTWTNLLASRNGAYATWNRQSINLTPYKSRAIQLRFSLTADGSATYAGVYLDSLVLSSTTFDTTVLPRVSIFPPSFNIALTDSVMRSLQICNPGGGANLSYSMNIACRGGLSPRILAWTYGADLVQEYANTVTAIMSNIPGAAITTTTTADANVLRQRLLQADVFLIPDQELMTPSSTIGYAFQPVLNDFMSAGGTVIVLYPYSIYSFLSAAGLTYMTSLTYTSSGIIQLVSPTHPIFEGISQGNLSCLSSTSLWISTGAASSLATYSSYTVVSEEQRGMGKIVMLGYDYYTQNTVWNKLLANTVNSASINPAAISADTNSGVILPDECGFSSLTFRAGSLIGGVHVLSIALSHNAYGMASPIIIPCTLTVPQPSMQITIPRMNVPLFTGDTARVAIPLLNNGPGMLSLQTTFLPGTNGDNSGNVIINEVCSEPDNIELLNLGPDRNMGGWQVVWIDDEGSSGSYTFPSSFTLRSGKAVTLMEGSGTSNDSIVYIISLMSWGTGSSIAVSLYNGSGSGVDFMRTVYSATLPPSGVAWNGTGVDNTLYYNMYRNSTFDTDSPLDWSQSSGYTPGARNLGQGTGSASSGISLTGPLTLSVPAGARDTLFARFNAISLTKDALFIDTIMIEHNAMNMASPMFIICTLSVESNIPNLIAVWPDPTRNRRSAMTWHPVRSGGIYTIQVDTSASFSTSFIVQQTTDTTFVPLINLPIDTIHWRVRCNSGIWSQKDVFIIQNDSVPLIIPITPDTLLAGSSPVFRWCSAVGATNYRIEIDSCGAILTPYTISFVADTFFSLLTTLKSGRYSWKVSADVNFNRYSITDTFWIVPSSAAEWNKNTLPKVFALHANLPNPFNPSTTIQYDLPENCVVELTVFNAQGRLVRRLVTRAMPAGYHRVEWDGRAQDNTAQPSGVYFYRIRAAGVGDNRTLYSLTKKMVMVQ
ncbi:MAG: hypothetical protein A2268_05205 [Candidatus Raymondbacteria bacterium RifOxyA12_full_50_37]|nr:MAG: hypothetical protein A2268_05205 [Candidatus Raymondbacteria bacterium RifOxyA12_full_50_37]OGJ88965.1 MAG: hypothetical protein A2248_02440 [Candidatus Raymondbacteria bacterium RIFOXYA2_FULL_49_16]OGJ96993.1 MAG: hypothetical protein A2453_03860 [Candidatus Raymondbacteria bacterium RIFOXYC2_FULL_50_21]OGK02538.1 MAG: hypothetical protein A2487_14925 [Candidatus Raymondbacteria bacterium RifOxyC12_full_50_8]OGP42069.1 MAG: hypothetical protein A2324_18080 [Candidatus Raymondbacteria b